MNSDSPSLAAALERSSTPKNMLSILCYPSANRYFCSENPLSALADERTYPDDTYRTIESPAEGIYKDKGSRFLAFAYPVRCEGEIKELVDKLKGQYYDARHHCYAWRLGMPGEPGERTRLNDDGEPAGSAARPIFGQLLSRELTQVLVVVVRYFGGIKLGVPGLIAAYKAATADALEAAKIITLTENRHLTVEFSYLAMNEVMKAVKDFGPRIIRQDFDNLCRMELEIRRRDSESLARRLKETEGVTDIQIQNEPTD